MPTTTVSLTVEQVACLDLLANESHVSRAELMRQGMALVLEERARELIHVRLLRAGYEISPDRAWYTHAHGPALSALELREATRTATGLREMLAKIESAKGVP